MAPPPANPLLPVVPDSVAVSPLLLALLHSSAFLDLCDDDVVDPKLAGSVLERVGLYVQRLDDDTVDALAEELERLSKHAEQASWPEPAREFIAAFLANCGFRPDDEDEDEENDEAGADDADDADDAEEE